MSKNNRKKICPRCQQMGTGPYARWVLNSVKKRYEPFLYFCHKTGKKIKWCYLGRPKPELSNTVRCVECACLEKGFFCSWMGAFIEEQLLTKPFECDGFRKKSEKVKG